MTSREGTALKWLPTTPAARAVRTCDCPVTLHVPWSDAAAEPGVQAFLLQTSGHAFGPFPEQPACFGRQLSSQAMTHTSSLPSLKTICHSLSENMNQKLEVVKLKLVGVV